jgi:glycine/D-amino acid oxidase-like deaminating enzyme
VSPDVFANLKTECLWTEQAPPPPDLGSDPLPERADVAIVGGGFTGLSAALQLAKLGARAVVLEAEHIGWGASSRNGGMTATGVKESPESLFRRYGPRLGRALWQGSVDAITCVETIVNEEAIECDFARCGSFDAASKPAHFEAMRRSVEWAKRELNHEQQIIPRSEMRREIGTDLYYGGVADPLSGGLHPAKYVFGLGQAAARAGATLCGRTPVQSLERRDGAFHLSTPAGTLRANEVLIATNGYTGPLTPALRPKVITIGSYIIATEPLSPELQRDLSPRNRMFFDTKWFLNYFRLTPDGRMLFGGRTRLTPHLDLRENAPSLREAMVKVYPQLRDTPITHSWSGHLGLTFDMLPHLGRVNGLHYALGYSGHGVALATYLGQQAGELLAGRRTNSPFLEVKHPTRFFYQGQAWFLPFLEIGLRALDTFT